MNTLFSKLLLDIICICLLGIPLFVFKFFDVPLTHRGFFCDDNELRYPYHNSSISSSLNIFIAFTTMFFLSVVVEVLINLKVEKREKVGFVRNPIVIEVYRGYFMVGAAINQILTDMCKLAVGRLRPHFFEVCRPDVVCSADIKNQYILNYTCTGMQHPLISPDDFKKKLRETGKSFPSGHSSLAIFASIFITIYLEYRARRLNLRLVRHLFQVLVLVWGLWVSCSRVFDNKHHPTDVMFGAVLGGLVAAFSGYVYISSRQSARYCPQAEDLKPPEGSSTLGARDEKGGVKEEADGRLLKAD